MRKKQSYGHFLFHSSMVLCSENVSGIDVKENMLFICCALPCQVVNIESA